MHDEGNADDGTAERADRRDVVVHRTVHSGAESLSVSVVEALAAAKGVSPVDIEQPLYDVVDPDALDRLFTDGNATARVVFGFADHEVTVHASGEILVRDRGSD